MSANLIAYERSTLVTSEKYIGLDVHQATISVAVMDSSGKLLKFRDTTNSTVGASSLQIRNINVLLCPVFGADRYVDRARAGLT